MSKYEAAPFVQPNGRELPPFLTDQGLQNVQAFFVPHAHEAGDVRLRVLIVRPDGTYKTKPRGTVLLHPGRTEFIEKYFETIGDLVARGLVVLALDPRGQGLSDRLTDDRLKSYVKRYEHYADDIGFLESELADELPRPHILMGHSMGGLSVIQAVLEKRADPDLLVASAPMLGLWDVATPILKYGFRAMDWMGMNDSDLPFQKQERGIPVEFDGNKLTSDPDRFRSWREYFLSTPQIRIAGPTIRWLAESVRAMDRVNRNVRSLDIPTLLIAPGADPIVDPESITSFARKSGAEVVVVAGARHEVFLEKDVYRQQFFDALDDFLERNDV